MFCSRLADLGRMFWRQDRALDLRHLPRPAIARLKTPAKSQLQDTLVGRKRMSDKAADKYTDVFLQQVRCQACPPPVLSSARISTLQGTSSRNANVMELETVPTIASKAQFDMYRFCYGNAIYDIGTSVLQFLLRVLPKTSRMDAQLPPLWWHAPQLSMGVQTARQLRRYTHLRAHTAAMQCSVIEKIWCHLQLFRSAHVDEHKTTPDVLA